MANKHSLAYEVCQLIANLGGVALPDSPRGAMELLKTHLSREGLQKIAADGLLDGLEAQEDAAEGAG